MLEHSIAPATGVGYEIANSLRFNDGDSAYLSRTPSTAGNRKTWTWSCWVKRGAKIGSYEWLFSANNTIKIAFNGNNVNMYHGGELVTNQVFRDPSAWYHLVWAVDTTQATASNRMKFYVNGEQVTSFSSENYPAQNSDTDMNNTVSHYIGQSGNPTYPEYNDGYKAEMYLIDGQALDPSNFGETGDYGEWKPIEYTGTYGTNGFYLPFKQDYEVEGFSTTLYTGDGSSSRYIGGTGFQPDLLWLKQRNGAGTHEVFDSVRGNNGTVYYRLLTQDTGAEDTASNTVFSLNSDGFTVGSDGNTNGSGDTMVAWSWDMGSSNATNTDGSITSTVRANPTYGQSIVSWTGDGGTDTIGHGLSSAPEMIISKTRNVANHWTIYQKDVGNDKRLIFTTAGETTDSAWGNTTPSNTTFTVATADTNGNTQTYIAYCFHSVSGYSKIGSYTGTGSSGKSVTTGFPVGFVIIKKTNAVGDWTMHDNVRGGDNRIYANESDVEGTGYEVQFDSNGFTLLNGAGNWNNSGDTYIYMAFADKREYAYWLDQSGNNNDWTSNNLTESDVSLDSPTNNFATLNPLQRVDGDSSLTFTQGNLAVTNGNSSLWGGTYGSLEMSSGKWYWEFSITSGSHAGSQSGIQLTDGNAINWDGVSPQSFSGAILYEYQARKRIDGSFSSYGSSYGIGDIIGVAVDVDGEQVTYYKNGVSQGSIAFSLSSYTGRSVIPALVQYTNTITTNFGQDSSFAGNKTAQGNTDDNGYGDFYYTPPSGYLALCTQNLPDPTVVPSEHFNTVTYTGSGTGQSISNIGFQPSLVWTKGRSSAKWHMLYDAVRGGGYYLGSNATQGDATDNTVTFDTDGYTCSSGTESCASGVTYVAWNWKANGSGSSNTNGTITSTVSANQDAGFSIVSYTGNGTAGATVGHGLSQAPEMVIAKGRDNADNWRVGSDELTSWGYNIALDITSAEWSNSGVWNSTAPTNSLFSLGTDGSVNSSGNGFIAYCFHSVDGYSKVGSYTGNGSTDGTFVYTGFRPAYVMVKRTDASGETWAIHDGVRSDYNPTTNELWANLTNAEQTSGNDVDLLSNGFKIKNTVGQWNTNGGNYIFLAFAENPFKHSNAR